MNAESSPREIWEAAWRLVACFGVVNGAHVAGVHRETLRAAVVKPCATKTRTARRIVQAARIVPDSVVPPAPAALPYIEHTIIPWGLVRQRGKYKAAP